MIRGWSVPSAAQGRTLPIQGGKTLMDCTADLILTYYVHGTNCGYAFSFIHREVRASSFDKQLAASCGI